MEVTPNQSNQGIHDQLMLIDPLDQSTRQYKKIGLRDSDYLQNLIG